jgi:hypothetical protein
MQTYRYTWRRINRDGSIWTLPVLIEEEQGLLRPAEVCLERVGDKWADPRNGVPLEDEGDCDPEEGYWDDLGGRCARLSFRVSRMTILARRDLLNQIVQWCEDGSPEKPR